MKARLGLRSPATFLVGLALAFSAGCGPGQELLAQRNLPIINGHKSAPGFLPAVGALVINIPNYMQSFCTGTLIAKRWVLTAGHCLEAGQIPAFAPLGFLIGNEVYSGGSKNIVPIKAKYPHPQYKGGQPPGGLADWHDIGLVELAQDAPTEPMKMIRSKEVGTSFRIGGDMLLVGFGLTKPNDAMSSGTKYDGVTQLAMIGKSEIYVYAQTGATTCQGDSGGPTFLDVSSNKSGDWRHVGVTSRGAEGCTDGSVNTRTDTYLTWIHSVAKDIPCGSGLSADCGATPPPTKKGLGADCTAHAECESNTCAQVGGQGVCTQICDTRSPNCPADYTCAPVDADGIKGVCLKQAPPAKKGLGDPCGQHEECQSGLCASQGELTFCTQKCTPGGSECGSLVCADAGGGQFLCSPDPSSQPSDRGCSVASAPSTIPGWLAIAALLGLALVFRRRR